MKIFFIRDSYCMQHHTIYILLHLYYIIRTFHFEKMKNKIIRNKL